MTQSEDSSEKPRSLSRWPAESVRYGIGLAVAFAYLWLSNRFPLTLAGDQKAYLSTALEMRESGSWLIPRLMGEPSYLKPPLLYWCLLISWKFLGLNWFASILPSLISALGSAWALDTIVFRLDLKRYAKFRWAGMVMLSMLGSLFFSQTAQMESMLIFFQLWAWVLVIRGLSLPFESRRWTPSVLAFGVAGLGALVKSPLYSVFWVVGYGLYLLLTREWKELRSTRFWLSLLFGMGIGLSWFLIVYFVDRDHFWGQYVVYETIEKRYGNGGSVFKLWGAWLGWILPWVLPIFLGIWAQFRTRLNGRFEFSALAAFGIATTLPAALFFTVYPYRVDTYLHFLLPGSALLALVGVKEKWGHLFLRLTLGLILFPSALALGYFLSPRGWELVPPSIWSFWIALGVIAGFSAVWNLLWSDQNPESSIAVPHFIVLSLLLLGAFRMTTSQLATQDLAGLQSAFSARTDEAAQSRFSIFDPAKSVWSERGLFSVVLGSPIGSIYSTAELDQKLRAGETVVLDETQMQSVIALLQPTWSQSHLVLRILGWQRWAKRGQMRLAQDPVHYPEQIRRKWNIIWLSAEGSTNEAPRNPPSQK